MRIFSTFRAVPAALPLLAAALLWACNADTSASGAGSSDALKGGIPAHGKSKSDAGDQAGKGGSKAEDHDDDAGVDEDGDKKKDAGHEDHADKPEQHDQDSGVDEDDQGDESDHGDKGDKGNKGDHGDQSDER